MTERLAAIKRLYYEATRSTIERDFDRAIDLLKEMATEDERERATVYMAGLAQMRSEWQTRGAGPAGGPKGPRKKPPRKTKP